MNHYSKVLRCPACGNRKFKTSRRYPGVLYCSFHGIALTRFDYSALPLLFSAMSALRCAHQNMELFEVNFLLTFQDRLLLDVKPSLGRLIHAYDLLVGRRAAP